MEALTFRQKGALILSAYTEALDNLKAALSTLPNSTLNCTYDDESETQNFDAMYAYEWYDTLEGTMSVQERRIVAMRLRKGNIELQTAPLDYEEEAYEEDPWSTSLWLGVHADYLAFGLTMDSILDSIDEYLTTK